MLREKAQAAPTARLKVPMRRLGADCFVVVMKRGNEPAMVPFGLTCGLFCTDDLSPIRLRMQLVPVVPKPGLAPCKSFTSVGCAQQFLLELRRRRTFRARAVSQTSIQMMRPDELFGKDKGSLRRDSSCQNQKEKTMPNTVSTQAISDLGPKL